MPDLFRHIAACRNAVLPGARLPFRLGPHRVGWVLPSFADRVLAEGAPEGTRRDGDEIVLDDPAALPRLGRRLAECGAYRFRDEAFDVRAEPGGPVLAQIDRGALPSFGVWAEGVHLNGLVHRPNGPWLWVGRRAKHKRLDPGKLDHIVAGGVPAGLDADAALLKEAQEEASLPAELARYARRVATLSYAMERPEGLRRDRLHCYDLELPDGFTPRPGDDEVDAFELWPLPAVLDRVRRTGDFKFNVNLVLLDLFLRAGLIDPAGEEGRRLRAGLDAA